MKNKKLRRADPLWLTVCRLWDELDESEHREIVQAVKLLVETKRRRQGEGPDVDADTPAKGC